MTSREACCSAVCVADVSKWLLANWLPTPNASRADRAINVPQVVVFRMLPPRFSPLLFSEPIIFKLSLRDFEAEGICLRGRGPDLRPKRIRKEQTAIHVGTVLGQTCDWGRWYRGGVLLVPTYSQF